MDNLIRYTNTNSIIDDASNIIDSSQRVAIQSVNFSLVIRNWLLGKRISEEELKNENRAEYGMEVVKKLSAYLTEEYKKGFSKRTVYKFLQFYKTFPEIVPTVSHNCYRGRTMNGCYKLLTVKHESGTRKKHMSKLGV